MRLAPRDFWAMSLKEWTAALDGLMESLGHRNAGGMHAGVVRDLKAMLAEMPEQRT